MRKRLGNSLNGGLELGICFWAIDNTLPLIRVRCKRQIEVPLWDHIIPNLGRLLKRNCNEKKTWQFDRER